METKKNASMYTYMPNPAVFVDCEEEYAVVWVGWGHTCVSSTEDEACLGFSSQGDLAVGSCKVRYYSGYNLTHYSVIM